jgi:chromate reductase, NAD(P)H dehydrogenase (quinone)
MRVLGIVGSLRRNSYNRLLLRAAAERAPKGMSLDIDEHLSALPLFNEDLEGEHEPEAVALLRDEVRTADGLLIATPEYNQSIPGVLKNAIDWLSRQEDVLSGKPVAIIGASSGRWGTRLAQAALRQTLYATEAFVLPKPALYVAEAARLFDLEGRLIDGATSETLDQILTAFQKWIAWRSGRDTRRQQGERHRAVCDRDRPSPA